MMDSIGQQARQLANLLEPLAAMMLKRIHPLDDELSMSAAYKAYGRVWIEDHRRRGNLTPHRRGNRLLLSRADCETLLAVDNQTPKVIFKHK